MRWLALSLLVVGCQAQQAEPPAALGSSSAVAPPSVAPAPPPAPSPAPTQASIETPAQGKADGEAAAHKDLANGVLGYYTLRTEGGMKPPDPGPKVEFQDVLRRDFGVSTRSLTVTVGCIPAEDRDYKKAFADAYNDIMVVEIARKHGQNVFPIAHARAERETKKLRAAGARAVPNGCNPPYRVDEHGIRRAKPECL